MIILHPCTDQFDNEHHAPYIEFVHRLLPETRDAMELHHRDCGAPVHLTLTCEDGHMLGGARDVTPIPR